MQSFNKEKSENSYVDFIGFEDDDDDQHPKAEKNPEKEKTSEATDLKNAEVNEHNVLDFYTQATTQNNGVMYTKLQKYINGLTIPDTVILYQKFSNKNEGLDNLLLPKVMNQLDK